ncbi:MAG: hypothetical protein LBT66_08515 [Methanobrevibacter sp.]|nr:hypothetical protein [Candidatus Methanovirga meridionalis]
MKYNFKKTIFGNIPINWEIIDFKDVLIDRTEKSNDTNINMYSVTNKGIIPRADKFNKKLADSASKFKLIYKNDLVFGMSREILNWGIMKEDVGGVSSAYKVFKIDNSINPMYVELFIKHWIIYFMDIIKPASREGQSIDKSMLFKKSMYVIPKSHQDKILYVLNKINEKIENNKKINKNLHNRFDKVLNK